MGGGVDSMERGMGGVTSDALIIDPQAVPVCLLGKTDMRTGDTGEERWSGF